MMYDIESIEVLVHNVRMQLVDVFRWVCPRGGGGGGFREVSVLQGSMFFCSQDWRFPVADRCAGL